MLLYFVDYAYSIETRDSSYMCVSLCMCAFFHIGVLSHLEVYVRCFYRRAFIDVLRKKEDKAFWLNQILKPYPIVHQARLLQILFLLKSNGLCINYSKSSLRLLYTRDETKLY